MIPYVIPAIGPFELFTLFVWYNILNGNVTELHIPRPSFLMESLSAHAIGVDAQSGLVHTLVGTAANVSDVTQAQSLLMRQARRPTRRLMLSAPPSRTDAVVLHCPDALRNLAGAREWAIR